MRRTYLVIFTVMLLFLLFFLMCRPKVTDRPQDTFSLSMSHQKGTHQRTFTVYYNDSIVNNLGEVIVDTVYY